MPALPALDAVPAAAPAAALAVDLARATCFCLRLRRASATDCGPLSPPGLTPADPKIPSAASSSSAFFAAFLSAADVPSPPMSGEGTTAGSPEAPVSGAEALDEPLSSLNAAALRTLSVLLPRANGAAPP